MERKIAYIPISVFNEVENIPIFVDRFTNIFILLMNLIALTGIHLQLIVKELRL